MEIYLKTADKQAPSESHFIVAGNGKFVRRINALMDVTLRVDRIPVLLPQEEKCVFKYPRFSQCETSQAFGFFYQMYKKYGGESIILIYWNHQNGYLLHAPEQKVSRETIHYSPKEKIKGYLLAGSIHCHGRAMAYHSRGHEDSDHEDEVDFDGLHITVGNINAKILTISCSIMVNGRRFMLNPGEYLDGIEEVKIIKTISKPLSAIPDNSAIASPNQPVFSGYDSNKGIDAYSWRSPMHELYFAPLTGLEDWELLLPKGAESVENNDFDYSQRQLFISKLERFWAGGEQKSGGNNQIESQKKITCDQGYIRNPLDDAIPFFFRLHRDSEIKELVFPDVWYNKVTKLPLLERLNVFAKKSERKEVWKSTDIK